MADDPIQMIWEVRVVGYPVGTHLAADATSLLAFNDITNALQTHATLGPSIEAAGRGSAKVAAERGSAKVAAVLALGIVVGAAGAKAVPRLRLWKGQEARRRPNQVPVDDFCVAVESAVATSELMSSADAERPIQEALLAAAIIAEHLRALAKARIEVGASPELQVAMDKLTAPRLTDSLNRMLAAERNSLDVEKSAAFFELFGGGATVDGTFMALRNDRVVEALRLPHSVR